MMAIYRTAFSPWVMAWITLSILVFLPGQGTAQELRSKGKMVLGYYVPFGLSSPQFDTISRNRDAITVISPRWFEVGDIEGTTTDERETAMSLFCIMNGMKVWPIIANGAFTYDKFHPLIAEPERRAKLVQKIVDLMSSCAGCEGINIDLEGINPSDRAVYNEFLKDVSERLHKLGFLVTIDVPAETKDQPQSRWSGAFDYKEINKYCDYICLMTYDLHVPSGAPGPVSGADWVERCMAYATSVIPKEKILMGLPFYGYDWCEDKTARSHSFRYLDMVNTIQQYGIKIQWDEKSKSPWYSYQDSEGKKRVAWFDDRRSIAEKLKIAKKYDVAGICIWSMGKEDPEVWKEIRDYQQGK